MGDTVVMMQADGVLRIEIRRPEKKNALSAPMYAALADAIAACESDPFVRVLLLLGQPDVFCSGNDMQDFMQSARPSAGTDSIDDGPVLRFMRALSQATKPVVAAVNGLAIGVGATMLLHCDLVCASDSARFQFPFVALGLCPEFGASLLMPARAGYQRSAELLMLAEPFSAAKAKEYGLINEVAQEGRADEWALQRAQRLAKMPAGALRLTKRLLKQADATALQKRLDDELHYLVECVRSPEAAEAFAAFAQRRPADFSRFD
ncbi:enoyl-CoA hydratase [Burkholderia sp. BCC1977]|uniref:enoyl-CoA hydratase n=1 Tax=Burkholderia sp. BCC1977 TaxID=2817440 RepID=UPI002ABE1AB0|nr:enoyl-CoA hydratase [Burkholderia sp. BCC1977]